MADYAKAIELKPDYAHAYNNRGLVKKAKNDLDGAMADYTKAIELKPDYAHAYNNRGILRYNQRSFMDALVDFRKTVELNSAGDYGRFRIWLIRARLGEKEKATKELEAYLKNRNQGKPGDWPSQIIRFLVDRSSESDFFNAASNPDKKIDKEQHCEAYFYAGTKRLIAGDKTTAQGYFEKCLATDVKNFGEYSSAAVELKYLKAP